MAGKPPSRKRTLYDILGVPRDAMAIDIGMAYKKRLAELDRKADADPNEVALVREAYHILCQPRERESYDASLITREEREEARSRSAPDIVLEADEGDAPMAPTKKRTLWIVVGALVAVLAIVLWVVTRQAPGDRAKAAGIASEEAKPVPPPPPPPPPKKRNATEVLGLVTPAIAGVVAYDTSGKPKVIGSGLLVAADAIVTTCHALPPSSTVVARLGVEQVPAIVAIYDEDLDLCRLTIAKSATAPLVASGEEPKAGDVVFAVGQHKGNEISVVEATVKAVRAAPTGRLIELSVPVPAGASGGGLFDAYGRLAGVLTDRAGSSGALPAGALAQMRTRGKPPPAQ